MKRFMNKKVAAIGLAAGLALGVAGAAVRRTSRHGPEPARERSARTSRRDASSRIRSPTTVRVMCPARLCSATVTLPRWPSASPTQVGNEVRELVFTGELDVATETDCDSTT